MIRGLEGLHRGVAAQRVRKRSVALSRKAWASKQFCVAMGLVPGVVLQLRRIRRISVEHRTTSVSLRLRTIMAETEECVEQRACQASTGDGSGFQIRSWGPVGRKCVCCS